MKILSIVTALMIPLAAGLGGCGGGPREDIGTVVGAVAGGAIGNQFGKGSGRTAATIGRCIDRGYRRQRNRS